jgi:hypothetical protein
VPRLPDWAIPKRSTNGKPKPGTNGIGNHRHGFYRDELVAEIQKLSGQVGVGLSRELLRRFGGADEVQRIRDIVKLTMLMERMEHLARGVARLKRALETAGEEPYRKLWTELNLPGDSIDDIPSVSSRASHGL